MEAAIALCNPPVGELSGSPLERSTYSFVVAGRALRVTTNDAWVNELLRTTYAPLAQSSCDMPEAVDISPGGGFAQAFYAVRNCFAAFAAQTPGCIAFYAACVAVNERAILLIGPSTIGKTILSFNVRSFGARFLGDELLLLNLREGTVRAIARTPALREPGLPYLLACDLRRSIVACNHALHTERGRLWYALDARTLGFGADDGPYQLGAVYVASRRDSRAGLRALAFTDGFTALLERMHGRAGTLGDLARLHTLVRGVPMYDLTIGPPHETAQMFLQNATSCG